MSRTAEQLPNELPKVESAPPSKRETIMALFKKPKISSKGKQRYDMAGEMMTTHSDRAAAEDEQLGVKLECGCIVDYLKKAFVFSSTWCSSSGGGGTPAMKLKQCSWSQVEIIRNELSSSSSTTTDGDELCGASTTSSSSSSAMASDSGLSSGGEDTSAESSPKLLSACLRFADALSLHERSTTSAAAAATAGPEQATTPPPVKPPRLLKKRKAAAAANATAAASATVVAAVTGLAVPPPTVADGLPVSVCGSVVSSTILLAPPPSAAAAAAATTTLLPTVILCNPISEVIGPIVTAQPTSTTTTNNSRTPAPSSPSSPRSPLRTHILTVDSHCPRCLGIQLTGGQDTDAPVAVARLEDGSPAQGLLREGDLLWSLDGNQLQGLTHAQVVQSLCNAVPPSGGHPKEVCLVVLPFQGRPLETSMATVQSIMETRGGLTAIYHGVPRYHKACTHFASKAPANLAKNRYNDIVAYDSTRVLLTPTEYNGHSDYINANYVTMALPGTQLVNRYIATQGPKSSTVEDFWQMVLEQGCRLVVMLTTLNEGDVVKCFKYWPDQGSSPLRVKGLRGWEVRQMRESRGSAWITRHFGLRCDATGEERSVTHLQYTMWPDHGVPHDSRDFIDFVHLVRDIRTEGPLAPVVVHCSAGIGRTGVLIMMETAMGLIEAGQAIKPRELLQTMREQRPSLVQTDKQFSFVVGAILRVFLEGEVCARIV